MAQGPRSMAHKVNDPNALTDQNAPEIANSRPDTEMRDENTEITSQQVSNYYYKNSHVINLV